MTTAREIVRGALTEGLNRLSPGEAEDADLFGRCLDALNTIVDEFNGSKSMLFREILSTGTVTAATGTLGTTWSSLAAGDHILGATYASGSEDVTISPLTMQQYHHDISDKTQTGDPEYYAHDGQATVYFYPVPTSVVVKLRTRQVVSDFADLATEYTMPNGYKSALIDLLAERMAASLLGGVPGHIERRAFGARLRLQSQSANPAILNAVSRGGGNIFAG